MPSTGSKFPPVRFVASSLFCILLAACGGGGDVAAPAPDNSSPPPVADGGQPQDPWVGEPLPPTSSNPPTGNNPPTDGTGTPPDGVAEPPVPSDPQLAAARFNEPYGIAVDVAGNLYIGDRLNHEVRKVTPGVGVTTLAGGYTEPFDTAVDAQGNVYISEPRYNRIRKIAADGTATIFAGSATPGTADGAGDAAQFSRPRGIATDTAGNVYVADSSSHLIRKITPAGLVTTVAGEHVPNTAQGTVVDGPVAEARFSRPMGITVDAQGDVYVLDSVSAGLDNWYDVARDGGVGEYTLVRKISFGTGMVSTIAGAPQWGERDSRGLPGSWGPVDSVGLTARFSDARDLAVDAAGNIYIADSFSHAIRKVTPDGAVSTLAGSPNNYQTIADGTGAAAAFSFPRGIAIDVNGDFFVTDSWSHTIRKVTQAGVVTTIAGKAGEAGKVDSPPQ